MASAFNGEGPQWPPRSPHEARMSTPGGRNRLRQLANTSPSPSPVKRSDTTSALGNRTRPSSRALQEMQDLDDDDDEETLQLRLQEIQARLKLKKLQKAKGKDSASDTENDRARSSAAPSRTGSRLEAYRAERLQKAKSQPDLHVPVSPVRKQVAPVEQRSPGRVLLGIDKGLKGSDVSLRRAPSLKKAAEERKDISERLGAYLQRPGSQTSANAPISRSQSAMEDNVRPKSFSERMADIRNEDADKKEKQKRIQQSRSKTFGIDEEQIEGFKKAASTMPEVQYKPPEFSREQVLSAFNKEPVGLLQRSKSAASVPSSQQNRYVPEVYPESKPKPSRRLIVPTERALKLRRKIDEKTPTFESFSSLHLSKRIIPHNVVARTLSGKRTYTVPDLLRDVKAPDFSLPDIEEDIVLLAVICAKSTPRQHQASNNTITPGKYMILGLCDLKWDLDLFLFNSAYDKFWKLDVGTVIAILNPSIYPPKTRDTGRFSIKITSSDDTVLEIGTARDLGFCKSVKKDGSLCKSWVDKRHTEFCEFHTNAALSKTKAGRMEVNSMDFGRTGGKKSEWKGKSYMSWDKDRLAAKFAEEEEKKQGIQYIREVGKVQVMPGLSKSAAALLDDEYVDADAFHFGAKQERMRATLAKAERERDIAKQLGNIGGGQGANYMRVREEKQEQQYIPTQLAPLDPGYQAPDGPPTPPDAKKLGLLGGNAHAMHLSPVKRKRTTGMGSQSSNTSARGWGGGLTKELSRMKEGESLQPVKKKTRIMTEKGIREPGRDSFGGEVVGIGKVVDDDDDDDDLEIIR